VDIEVNWSPAAVEDLEAIAEYVAKDSVFYAGSLVARFMAVCRVLTEFPYSGRVVPEIGEPELRERLVFSYRLVYRVDDNKILVVVVLHGKRLLDNIEDRL